MEIHLKRNLLWHWVLVNTKNGQTLATSETYYSKGNAKRAALKLADFLKVKFREV